MWERDVGRWHFVVALGMHVCLVIPSWLILGLLTIFLRELFHVRFFCLKVVALSLVHGTLICRFLTKIGRIK